VHTLRVKNTPEGFKELRGWASGFEGRVWAIEGASNPFVSSWVSELLAAGEEVVNIPPSMTSQYRCRHSRKKNDLVDAHNAARALLANPELPPYAPPAQQRRLQVLSRTRRRLAVQLKANGPQGHARGVRRGARGAKGDRRELPLGAAHEVRGAHVPHTQEERPEILAIRGEGPVLGPRSWPRWER